MRGGKRLLPAPTLTQIREHAKRELDSLPDALKRLEPSDYPVTVAQPLRAMAAEIDARAGR